ncbi:MULTISPECIES: LppX_LprAFG lipoprotein [unclassified Streptomyces]|uniref:LppX_LprAFG lipoprotein n=1 Tax=unclassified Streptomyces TaxID=2593676 RepID=UPI0004BE554E|nr:MULTISPECIES: LppX_LprAFG lipoprotein [unclassified Streptomyces]
MNNRSVRLPVGAGLAALLLAAGAVSCGKGEEAADKSPAMTPAAAVAKVAKKSEQITSMHYRMKGSIPGQGRIEAEADMRMKPEPAMSMRMFLPGKTDLPMEVRLIDKAIYVDGGEDAAKEMDGKNWIKFDLSGTEAGKQLDQMGGLGAASQAEQSPTAQSNILAGADDVKKIDTVTVGGVRTTHYRGTVAVDDMEKPAFTKSGVTEEQRRKAVEQYRTMGVDRLTMDMWVGGDDRMKQFRMRADADKGPMDMTFTVLDYNKPVKVTAPPAGKTADLAEMLKGLQDA